MELEILLNRVNDLEVRVNRIEQKLDALIATYNEYEESNDENIKALFKTDRGTNERVDALFKEIRCIKNDLAKKGDSDEYSRFLHIIESLLELKVNSDYVRRDYEDE